MLKRENQGESEFMFAVVPACKSCNNVNTVKNLDGECTAVTILNFNTLKFVGNIYVPTLKKTRGSVEMLKKLAKEATDGNFDWIDSEDSDLCVHEAVKSLLHYYEENNHAIPEDLVRGGYWREITGITTAVIEPKKSIKIEGKTPSSGNQKVIYTYEDPDAFLQALVLLYTMKSTITPLISLSRSTKDSKNFMAELVKINQGKYPTNCQKYLSNNSVETAEASNSDPGVEESKSSS